MEVIVTHLNADFDALASLVAAKLLYPGARMLMPGSPEKIVKSFVNNFRDKLSLSDEDKIAPEKISRLIVVDTRHKRRLGRLGKAIWPQVMEVHIYDHHAKEGGDIKSRHDFSRIIGATTTILLEKIREKNLSLSPFEATVMLLGVYQDTGSLSYPSTTPRDKLAARFLCSQGADLGLVNSYLAERLSQQQMNLYRDLKKDTAALFLKGQKILIATAEAESYIPNLAALTHKLMSEFRAEAAFTLAKMGKLIHLVARSSGGDLRADKIVCLFGGGGHATAGYARLKGVELLDAKKNLLKILKEHFQKYIFSDKPETLTGSKVQKEKGQAANLKQLMKKRLSSETYRLLCLIGEEADKRKIPVFVVGGLARDLILGFGDYDIDIVVEGSGIDFAQALSRKTGSTVRPHKKFGTASLYLKNGRKIDVATARTEYYLYPAALPEVAKSSLKHDLYRRDFTINAMAVCLNNKRFGKLLDFFGGRNDLQAGIIRSLHDLSFIEDPTRVFRAVRFEQRYAFKIDRRTQHLIRTAINLEMFDWLTNKRVLTELVLMLSEEYPFRAIRRMAQFNELRFIHPRLRILESSSRLFLNIKSELGREKKRPQGKKITPWSIYFLALLDSLNAVEAKEVCEKYSLSRKMSDFILKVKNKGSMLANVLAKKKLRPSEIYEAMKLWPEESLIFLLAKSDKEIIRKRVNLYLVKLRTERPLISGREIAALGLKEGPYYKDIFREILNQRLDGRIKTREEEIDYIRENLLK